MAFSIAQLEAAHEHSSRNREELSRSDRAGCFYCQRSFSAQEVREWLDEAPGTGLCPYCGIDSVLGDASGISVASDVLSVLHDHWFDTETASSEHERWTLGQGDLFGDLVVVRSLSVDAPRPDLPVRVGFAVSHTLGHQQHDAREHERLGRVETALIQSVGRGNWLHSLVVTSARAREWIYYAASIQDAEHCVLRVKAIQPELTHYIEDDPTWQLYARLLPR